jgi:hypothetical protein
VQPTLFQERDSRAELSDPSAGQTDHPAGPGGDDGAGSCVPGPQPDGPGGNHSPGRHARQGDGPSVAALVNLTVPLDTVLGLSATPGEATGFGLLDAEDARDLAAAAARHPDTRWCVTALYPDGTAAAHGCARGRHPPPPSPGPAGTGGDPPGPGPPPDSSLPAGSSGEARAADRGP